ncbi:MAG: hypothetical protein PHP92_03770 [Candidatus Nanoarchaeia archaeon]|nr:hypothetical protein [Candidatus Nanoarchaeia archaeon]
MVKVFNLSKSKNITWVDNFIYTFAKKLNLKKESDSNKNKDKITKLSYKEAEKIGLVSEANYIGWNMWKENSGVLDSGSVWYLESDEKTGEKFLIKNLSQEGEIVRRVMDKIKNAKKEKLELNKKAEIEKSKEDLKNEKQSRLTFLNKRLSQLTRSIKKAEAEPEWIPPEYLLNMKKMSDEIRDGITQLEKELHELEHKIDSLGGPKPSVEDKIINSKAWKGLNKKAEDYIGNMLKDSNLMINSEYGNYWISPISDPSIEISPLFKSLQELMDWTKENKDEIFEVTANLNKKAEGEIYNTLEEANTKARELKDQTGKEFEPVQSATDNTKFELKPKVAGKGVFLWMRLGDNAEYEIVNSYEEVADILLQAGISNSIKKFKSGITDHNIFADNNYISLYWGDSDAEFIQDIEDEDINAINRLIGFSKKESHLKQATGMIKTVDEAIEYLFLYHEKVEKIGDDEYKLIDTNDGTEEIYDIDGLIERANRYWQLYEDKNASLKQAEEKIQLKNFVSDSEQFINILKEKNIDYRQIEEEQEGILVARDSENDVIASFNMFTGEVVIGGMVDTIDEWEKKNASLNKQAEDGKERNPKVMEYMIEQAKQDKEWAEKTKDNQEWLEMASDMSMEMLQNRLNKSVEQLAEDSYDYLEYRSHLKEEHWGYIDKSAKELWEKLTGEKLAQLHQRAEGLYNITVLINGVKKEQVQEALNYLDKYELKDLGINPEDIKAISQNEKGYVASLESRNISKENLDVLSELLSDAEHELGTVSINLGANQVESKAQEKSPEKKVEKKNPKESEIEKKVPMEVSKEDEVKKPKVEKEENIEE